MFGGKPTYSPGWGQSRMSDGRKLTPVREEDYELIEQAVMETSRGRWFLAEYARRNRSADTRILLDAIKRLERVVSAQTVEFVPTLESTNAVLKIRSLMQEAASDMAALLGQLEGNEDRLAARNDPLRAIDQVMKKQNHEIDDLVTDLRQAHDEIATTDVTADARRQVAQIIDRISKLSKGYHSVAQAVRRGISFIGVLDQMLAKEQRSADAHKAATQDATGSAHIAEITASTASSDPIAQVFGEKDQQPVVATTAADIAPEGRIVIVRAPKGKSLALPGFDDDAANAPVAQPRSA